MFIGIQFIFFILLCLIFLGPLIKGFKHRSKPIGKVILIAYACGFTIIVFKIIFHLYSQKKVLTKSDFYGEYTIDRDYFSGPQADWQYNTFRFKIKPNDSIIFYVTDKQDVKRIYKGTISCEAPYTSARLAIHMESPTHHILSSHPTIYRGPRSFILVFHSPKFNNMYFRKNRWEPLSE